MRRKHIIISTLFAILLAGCSQEEPDISLDEVTLVAGSIGGGWDITAQMIRDSLLSENLIDGEIQVVNHLGAGGELGWKYT